MLVLLAGLTFLAGLGRPAITDSDEAFYAESAREMVERGDWLTPHFNYHLRFEKPVLYYWLVAATYLVTGVTEAAARLPSALAGIGLVLVTFACARRWYDDRTASVAATMTATSFGYVAVARQALPDLPLAFFIVLATWAAMYGLLDDPQRRMVERRRWLVLAAATAAAACLMKGPIGLALPAIVILPLMVWEYRAEPAEARAEPSDSGHPAAFAEGFGVPGRSVKARSPDLVEGTDSAQDRLGRSLPVAQDRPVEARTTWARWRAPLPDLVVAAVVLVALAAPWYLAMTAAHGPEYLYRFFVAENVERFATDRYNDPRPLWYYPPIVFGGMLPWAPLMLLWVRPLSQVLRRTRRVSTVEIRLGVWAMAPLVFYTASIGKQPRYVLPILPPLVIVLARALTTRLWPRPSAPHAPPASDRGVTLAGVLAGIILALAGILLFRAQAVLDVWQSPGAALAAAIIVLAGTVIVAIAVAAPHHLFVAVVSSAVITTLLLQYTVLSPSRPEPVEQMARLITQARLGDEPYGRYRVFTRNLVFYTGIEHVELITEDDVVEFLKLPRRVLCVLDARDLEAITTRAGIEVERLGEVPYLNTGNLKLETLIRPDPARDIQLVVLVANTPGAGR
jgi:4-amino-4-deoxy-L-arabinose transferase-like glycosyltransferase